MLQQTYSKARLDRLNDIMQFVCTGRLMERRHYRRATDKYTIQNKLRTNFENALTF